MNEVKTHIHAPMTENKCFECLEAERDKLRTEVEVLIWNLAGCSTFALGYGIHEPFDKEKSRPAMTDVLKLALREEKFRKSLEAIRNELGVTQSGYPAPVANAANIAKEALSKAGMTNKGD